MCACRSTTAWRTSDVCRWELRVEGEACDVTQGRNYFTFTKATHSAWLLYCAVGLRCDAVLGARHSGLIPLSVKCDTAGYQSLAKLSVDMWVTEDACFSVSQISLLKDQDCEFRKPNLCENLAFFLCPVVPGLMHGAGCASAVRIVADPSFIWFSKLWLWQVISTTIRKWRSDGKWPCWKSLLKTRTSMVPPVSGTSKTRSKTSPKVTAHVAHRTPNRRPTKWPMENLVSAQILSWNSFWMFIYNQFKYSMQICVSLQKCTKLVDCQGLCGLSVLCNSYICIQTTVETQHAKSSMLGYDISLEVQQDIPSHLRQIPIFILHFLSSFVQTLLSLRIAIRTKL